MQITTMILAASLTMFGTQNMSPSAGTELANLPCRVLAFHDSEVPADLPAQQGGTLQSIAVKVGDYVKKGDVLATVDNELERLSLEVAKQRLEMAQKEAGNDVNVRYARTAAKVHEFRYWQVVEAVEKVPDTYSKSEVATYLLQANQFNLQIEQAEHELDLARMSVRVREAEYDLAKHELTRREIKAPVDGVIEAIECDLGDWVRAGDPIVRLIQMDRLKINAELSYGDLTPADVRGRTVVVQIHDLAPSILARDKPPMGLKPGQFQGVVNSTGSDFGRGDIRIIVEVTNRRDDQTGDWMLMPGMTGEMQIQGVVLGQ